MKAAATAVGAPAQFLTTTSLLSKQQVMEAIPLPEVVQVLKMHQIRFVVVGAYGLAEWRKTSRATEDVDVVVMAKHQKKAVRALLEAFPQLETDDQEVVTRLRDPKTGKVLVDVMKTNQPLYHAIFKHSRAITSEGQEFLIPSLEMALAMKFAAMISLVRADYKKYIDASDFIRMVQVNPDIDLELLRLLGELVYPGGGAEVVQKVGQVRAGEKLRL